MYLLYDHPSCALKINSPRTHFSIRAVYFISLNVFSIYENNTLIIHWYPFERNLFVTIELNAQIPTIHFSSYKYDSIKFSLVCPIDLIISRDNKHIELIRSIHFSSYKYDSIKFCWTLQIERLNHRMWQWGILFWDTWSRNHYHKKGSGEDLD